MMKTYIGAVARLKGYVDTTAPEEVGASALALLQVVWPAKEMI